MHSAPTAIAVLHVLDGRSAARRARPGVLGDEPALPHAALDAGELLERLSIAAAALGEAYARCADNHLLPTLDTIGRGVHGAQFVALMPEPSACPPPRPSNVGAHIARELSRLLSAELTDRRDELAEQVTYRRTQPSSWNAVVAAAITDRVPPPLTSAAPRG